MSRVVLIEATPWLASDGSPFPVRLAGGGSRGYDHLGTIDWRSGIVAMPRYTAGLGFDQSGWTGGAIPTAGALRFKPADTALVSQLADTLFWTGAPITIRTGDDATAAPAFAIELTGTVAAVESRDGALILTISDLSGKLASAAIDASFAGTGGIEGGADAGGRVKRRTWGRAYNVECRLLDKAYNIYEWGDPAFPHQACDALKDKGRSGGRTLLAWQGSIDATLAALRGAVPPAGGGVVAPSICCAKWWTQPSTLTADIRGEICGGYVETVPEIAARIVAATSTMAIANLAEATAIRGAAAGIHIDSLSETTGNVLDRLLMPVSLLWIVEPTGAIRLREYTFDEASQPVEALVSHSVNRKKVYAPVKTRRIGYQRNHYQLASGDISIAATWNDGITPLDDLKPATAHADNTATTPTGAAVDAGLNIDGSVKDDKVGTGAIIEGSVTKRYFTQLASPVTLTNLTLVQVLSATVTKQEDESDIDIDCSLRLSSSDDIRGIMYIKRGNDVIDVFAPYANGANSTFRMIVPMSFTDSGVPAGTYVYSMAFYREGGASNVQALPGSNIRVKEIKR